jgi:hypothetical protein
MLMAAPVPRLPQPKSPTFNVSVLVWAMPERELRIAKLATADALAKSLRVIPNFFSSFMSFLLIGHLPYSPLDSTPSRYILSRQKTPPPPSFPRKREPSSPIAPHSPDWIPAFAGMTEYVRIRSILAERKSIY